MRERTEINREIGWARMFWGRLQLLASAEECGTPGQHLKRNVSPCGLTGEVGGAVMTARSWLLWPTVAYGGVLGLWGMGSSVLSGWPGVGTSSHASSTTRK